MSAAPAARVPTLGEIIAETLVRDFAREIGACEDLARYRASLELSRQIAPLIGCSSGEAWNALAHVPDNMLTLLRTPEGWAGLASYVAADFGRHITYHPTVH